MADSMFRYNFIFADTSVMFPLIFTFLFLQSSLLVSSFGGTSRFSRRNPTVYMDGDVIIDGVPLPLHYENRTK